MRPSGRSRAPFGRGLREIDLGARIGGDEFGVLAPRTNEESARVLAERLRALVATGVTRPVGQRVTISIGIASLVPSRDERPTPGSLLAAADGALYLAKRGGGDRVSDGRGASTAVSLRHDERCVESHSKNGPGRQHDILALRSQQ